MPDISTEPHYLLQELRALFREDLKLFDFLQEAALDGMWYWDLDNPEHEWMSPQFWKVLGYDPAQRRHLAAEWQSLIHPEDLHLAMQNFERHCADRKHPYDQTVRYQHRDGSTVWVRCRGMAVRDAQGKAIRMLGAHTDVSAEMRRADELQRALESNAELEQFAYMASHELREPLRMVGNYLQLLEAECQPLSSDARRYFQVVADSTAQLQVQVRGLLELSRIGVGTTELHTVEGSDLLQAAIALLREPIDKTSASVEAEDLPRLQINRQHGELVFRNLIANSLKFSTNTPRIRVRATRKGRWAHFVVEDNGIGVPEADRRRIFQVFQRLHARAEYAGVGLGLALVDRVIKHLGGHIVCEDNPSGGTRMCFTLPLAEEISL